MLADHHESFAPKSGENTHASDALRADFFKSSLDRAAALVAPEAVAAGPRSVGRVAAIPQPIQAAVSEGRPVHISSSGENQAANRQPDFFLTPEGKLVANEKATPSQDGSINIELQSGKEEGNESLRNAIMHQSEMQREAAKDMIRLFQKNNPGKPVPSWMQSLADSKPNLPDFVPFKPAADQPVTAPPENGFVNRGVGGGSSAGFAGNGGFDSSGMFRGNGGAGDGTLSTGASGKPLGPGETVQAKQIYDYLTEKHNLSPAVASGILGNMQTESGFKTNAYNPGEGAIGLCQWEGPRRTELERFAASEGKPVTDWHVQVDFMMKELQSSESGAFAKLQSAQSPSEAAAIFDKYYERSSGAHRGQRMANAENIHSQIASSSTAMA